MSNSFGVDVNEANPLLSRFEGQSPVMQVVLDILKRGIVIAPVGILIGYLAADSAGAWSVGFGLRPRWWRNVWFPDSPRHYHCSGAAGA
jgi:hypothetical protein